MRLNFGSFNTFISLVDFLHLKKHLVIATHDINNIMDLKCKKIRCINNEYSGYNSFLASYS